jgi:hypothetical protein
MAQTFIRGTQIRNLTIGVSKLDTTVIGGDGKLLASLLPAAIAGAMVYQGAFDASAAATPAAAATGNKGHYYIVSAAGNGLEIGDWVVSNGTSWDKIDNTEATETALTTSFDGTASGLVATTVQGAIDEVEGRVQTTEGAIGTLASLTTTEKGSLVGAVNELAAKSAGAFYVRETPTGAVDGTNADFTISQAAYAGTLEVYLNGLLQELTDDYTVAGTTVTMLAAPLAGDKVRVKFFKA